MLVLHCILMSWYDCTETDFVSLYLSFFIQNKNNTTPISTVAFLKLLIDEFDKQNMAYMIVKVVYYLCTVLGTKDRCSKLFKP